MKSQFLAIVLLALAAPPVVAQSLGPQPLVFVTPIPPPRDVAYPGTVRLSVDATDLDRRIIRVRETLPVSGPGPIVLLFPKWLPGKHSPVGELDNLTVPG